jgi:DNA replication licensing factor MCM7
MMTIMAMEQVNREQAAAAAAATGEDGAVNIYAGAGNPQGDETTQNTSDASEQIPPELLRRYELRILPLGRRGTHAPFHEQFIPHKTTTTKTTTDNDALSLRQVKSEAIGRLVTVLGLIVRCSDVKPSCTVAVYSCDACGAEIYQPIPYRREFMPARACTSPHCPSRGGTGRRRGRTAAAPPTTQLPPVGTLHLQTRGSKFIKFQELKIQELPSQVPMGHVPRSMSVYCRGELTRQVNPGDMVTIDGIFLPQKLAESGYKALKAGLISTTYLEAQHVLVHKKSLDESVLPTLSEREQVQLHADIDAVRGSPDPLGLLSGSIAPEIFGHEDIKRALLLQLVGGVTRQLPDGMRIRGDINVCLMGDPGVAKSQLLKHVASMAPRGVYTTGKGSSGVGLTAAVTKDMTTGEMALEGGALVLAYVFPCVVLLCD